MVRPWFVLQADVPIIIIITYRPERADGAVTGKESSRTFWAH